MGPQFYQSWNDTDRPRQANELFWGDDTEISWNSWQNGNVPSPSQPFETPQQRYERLNSFKGGANSSAGSKASLSSFDVYDQIMAEMMDKSFYPNMRSIIILGHSGGAQVVQRHAIASRLEARPGVAISYLWRILAVLHTSRMCARSSLARGLPRRTLQPQHLGLPAAIRRSSITAGASPCPKTTSATTTGDTPTGHSASDGERSQVRRTLLNARQRRCARRISGATSRM